MHVLWNASRWKNKKLKIKEVKVFGFLKKTLTFSFSVLGFYPDFLNRKMEGNADKE
jgi:hypothetical protein